MAEDTAKVRVGDGDNVKNGKQRYLQNYSFDFSFFPFNAVI